MFHELRTYTCYPEGRAKLVEAFGKAMPIFERVGIRVVAAWVTYLGRMEHFVYLLEWNSLAEREEKWAKLVPDPEFQKIIMQATGGFFQFHDTLILKPTEYSPLK